MKIDIPVKINIVSKICDLAEAERLTGEDVERSFKRAAERRVGGIRADDPAAVPVSELVAGMMENAGERAVDKIEISTEGRMSVSDGRVKISYDETAATGMEGCETSLQFDAANPDIVTMLRTGRLNSALSFNAGSRQLCQYDTGVEGMRIEMTVKTHLIDNGITEAGGLLGIDYTIEAHGVKIEYSSFRMRVRPLKTAGGSL